MFADGALLFLTRFYLGPSAQSLSPSDTSISPAAADSNQSHQSNEIMTEKPKQQPPLVKIPSRNSSYQKPVEPNVPIPPVPSPHDESPPAPRRGSKRSLLSRSRNNSRSSRRSTKAARAGEDPKEAVPPLPQTGSLRTAQKPRSGFLAFLSCCIPHDPSDDTKSDDPDVSAKKIKIQPAAQRASRPQENEVVENEKPTETRTGVDDRTPTGPPAEDEKVNLSEKRTNDDSRPRLSREVAYHERPSPGAGQSNPTPALAGSRADDRPSASASEQDQGMTSAVPVPESSTNPNVIVIAATPIAAENPMHAQINQSENRKNSDVEMVDAPPVVPEIDDEQLDEPPQPADQQPQVPLPPPPPIIKRQEQVFSQEVPPVPDAAPEKQTWLLPPIEPRFKGRKCLVLDLDETLVHSSFKILNQADFTIPVEIEGQYHNVYVIKRPGVDTFMKRVGELYEVVVFTASVSKYGDPLLDQLDIHHVVHHRLFRESCYNHQGNYVKVSWSFQSMLHDRPLTLRQDLSQVGRELKDTIIIDNSPTSYIFHPQHAVPISSWFSDAHDNELLDLIPVLEDLAGPQVQDVSLVLDVAL